MWCPRGGSWFGCVWFGLFIFFLSIFGRRLCFRKVCSVGLYHWKTFLSCSTHMPQAWTQQIPAPRKSRAFYLWLIPFLDSLWTLPISSRANKFQMWCWFFRCKLPVRWELKRPLVWATHNWQMAVTLVTDDVGWIRLNLEEKETIIPLNNFLCATQSFY